MLTVLPLTTSVSKFLWIFNKVKMDQRSRGWCFTLNNYDQADLDRLPTIDSQYLVYGREIGESGTSHLQGFVYFTNARTGKSVKKKVSDRAHVEPMRGTPQQAADYCKKEGAYHEQGTLPQQGKRNDFTETAAKVLSGETTVDDLLEQNPEMMHQYGRTLDRVEDLRMSRQQRDFMTEGIWYYGSTGVGKSHRAANTPGSKYYHVYDNRWWDNYRQQDVVIMNEFRGQLTFSELLAMVDKWPHAVSRRGRCPVPFMSRTVVITSDSPPEQVYREIDMIRMGQLYRRFKVIFCENQTSTVEKNFEF